MESLRVAAATDDGRRFMGRHFGDAQFYEVLELSPSGFTGVCWIMNNVDEGEAHAAPKKAQGIAGILAEHGVQVAVAKAFGPNIKRIQKQFVCVLVRHDEIRSELDVMVRRFPEILAEMDRGEGRSFLDWRRLIVE